jgi:two-component system nitrogen regulation sensor histidine kinase NtrY
VFGREDRRPLAPLVVARPETLAARAEAAGGGTAVAAPPDTAAQHEVTLVHDGHERHLLAATTTLGGDGGALERVLVVDDVTPLVRAQKVAAWRDVARRLAHEIKNPLTPIQLSAERLKRHFTDAPEPTRRLVDECARAIVAEVESLKSLVDEFSQFARMPAPKAVPTDLNALLADALALYAGLLTDAALELTAAPDLPLVRLDPEQVRRVVINLVDNAIEALAEARETGRMRTAAPGLIAIDTAYLPAHGVVRLRVADNGPGLPAGDRSKLFMPYYSTKGRGSGLGLAIVRRIIAEHGGSIEAADNLPHGTCFTIELPV